MDELLELAGEVDLIIPRGSKELVRSIQARTRIPVMGHSDGVCHMYLDESAHTCTAVALVRDAKLQYPAACNAIETVLIHKAAAPRLVKAIAQDLLARGVELRGCPLCQAIAPMDPAQDADWDTEYGAPILSIKVVEDLSEALAHIRRHGGGHLHGPHPCQRPRGAGGPGDHQIMAHMDDLVNSVRRQCQEYMSA